MDEFKAILDSMDECELWAVQSDLALIFGGANYKPNINDKNFKLWYWLYDNVRTRIDRRLMQEADA